MRIILEDPALTKLWLDELDAMRARMRQVRARLAEAGMAGSVSARPAVKKPLGVTLADFGVKVSVLMRTR